jgi:transcriptional regulator with XRE-family HTH domain
MTSAPAELRRRARCAAHGVHVGPWLQAARKQKGLTVRALAHRIERSPSLIWQVENGTVQPSLRTFAAMVAALEVSVDELLDAPRDAAWTAHPLPTQSYGQLPSEGPTRATSRRRPALGRESGTRRDEPTGRPSSWSDSGEERAYAPAREQSHRGLTFEKSGCPDIVLRPGDSVRVTANRSASWDGCEPDAVLVVWVASPLAPRSHR